MRRLDASATSTRRSSEAEQAASESRLLAAEAALQRSRLSAASQSSADQVAHSLPALHNPISRTLEPRRPAPSPSPLHAGPRPHRALIPR